MSDNAASLSAASALEAHVCVIIVQPLIQYMTSQPSYMSEDSLLAEMRPRSQESSVHRTDKQTDRDIQHSLPSVCQSRRQSGLAPCGHIVNEGQT
jgi:hypothetical protein